MENQEELEGGEHIVETVTLHENEGTTGMDKNDRTEFSGEVSFDDLDDLMNERSDKDLLAEAAKESKKTQAKKDKSKTGLSDFDKAQKETTKEAKEESQQKEYHDYKKIQANYNDKALDIPADAKLIHKVNGEEVEVTVQELLNNFSGKQSWDRKYQDLAEEKKTFQSEVEMIERYVNTFADKAQTKDENGNQDFLGAMTYLAEMAGMDPLKFKDGVREQMLPLMAQWSNMNEDQRNNIRLREENAFLEIKKQTESELRAEEQANQALKQELSNLQRDYNLDDNTVVQAWDELVKEVPDSQDITNSMLVQKGVEILKVREAEVLISEVNPDVLNNYPEAAQDIANVMMSNPGFQKEEIVHVIEQVYGKRKEKVISEKVRASQPNAQSQQMETESTFGDDDVVSFDDL